ncbi:hypothetical protein T4B_9179 [Trichinella pseudospiralis]|uniref:Uncharacterized protein n=1 Tax=Trichinella pseudospiralis TaxID=6337 RepID=A0A0V1IIH0_TRIPS|nr:hypothetical protein T4B_9179 [Trichinella pseudospiralis]KRZ30775.1 hypothetical protein T4C_2796 [Trichinella pseudospiralis]
MSKVVNFGRLAGQKQTSTIQANVIIIKLKVQISLFDLSICILIFEVYKNERVGKDVYRNNYFNEQMKSLIISSLELVISRLATMMIGKHRRADDALITVARKVVLLPENF